MVSLLQNGVRIPIPYTPDLFEMGRNRFPDMFPLDLGFAGLRLHAPLNRPDVFDEALSFLGSSYFRCCRAIRPMGFGAGHRHQFRL